MLNNNIDLQLLRSLNGLVIDLIEEERRQNAVQDSRLDAIEHQFQELEDRINSLAAEFRIVNRSQAEKIAELECLQDPYSPDGDPISNRSYSVS
ncbi:MAG: hypothetical protein KME26_08505 [Oscillatoria princeps RMCB-10]|jgi:hypothetical protein|nr:hypothetical protein [Oscillatoria princeps RMCB-10]